MVKAEIMLDFNDGAARRASRFPKSLDPGLEAQRTGSICVEPRSVLIRSGPFGAGRSGPRDQLQASLALRLSAIPL